MWKCGDLIEKALLLFSLFLYRSAGVAIEWKRTRQDQPWQRTKFKFATTCLGVYGIILYQVYQTGVNEAKLILDIETARTKIVFFSSERWQAHIISERQAVVVQAPILALFLGVYVHFYLSDTYTIFIICYYYYTLSENVQHELQR